jgi:hypothetical protein
MTFTSDQLMQQSQRLRIRAKDTRETAQAMTHPSLRRIMLDMATSYEKMAGQLERAATYMSPQQA